MSTFHDIRKLQEIQDTNLIFDDNYVIPDEFKRMPCKYVIGK